MRFLISLTITTVVIFSHVHCLPVRKEKKDEIKHEPREGGSNEIDIENVIEYERYLKEVVNALESDVEFRKKLENASEADVRTGQIAHELEFVNHNVRTKLDELKRQELQRLRSLATKQFELTNDIDREHMKIEENHHHIDHDNQHTFEIEDLKKLILKTSADLTEADRRRREDFKEYELQKEFEKQEKLQALDEEHRKQYEKELKEKQEKHDKHEKVHHPGNKAQLEEVWEKQDHMDPQDFNPQTFFMMHDLDGNNFWDENEVKALFVKELDKLYTPGMPEDDMRERAEEMERMREQVFKSADTNHDNLLSYEEFIEQTKRDEYKKDPNWETVDHQPQFTHEEYLEFERRRHEEIQRLVAEGKLPPHPNMPGGYYPSQNGQYQVPQNQHGQEHPNAIPAGQHYPQPVNYHPNQVYEHVPQQQYQQPPPQQHYQQQQAPPQQYQQQNYQQQHPPQQQQYQPPPPQQQQYQQPPPQQQQYQQPPPQQQQYQQPPPPQQQYQQPPPPQQQQPSPQQNKQPPPQQQVPSSQPQPNMKVQAQPAPQQNQKPAQAQQQPQQLNNHQPPVGQQQEQIKTNNIPSNANQLPQNEKSESHPKA